MKTELVVASQPHSAGANAAITCLLLRAIESLHKARSGQSPSAEAGK